MTFLSRLVLLFFLIQSSRLSAQELDTLFFDDFDRDELNRDYWNVIVTGFVFNNEQQAYVDSSATIKLEETPGASNGALILQAHYAPGFVTEDGKQFDFLSGRINTNRKVTFTYGTAAARIKMTEGSGLWPAFWALGDGKWPAIGEIDIMEYVGEPDWIGVALHGPGYSGETPLVNKYFFPEGEDVTDWHVYSVDWTRGAMYFRLDGRLVYRVTRSMVKHYGDWAFDNPKHLILNLALGGAYPFKNNGVKEPYLGIPAETVERIKSGESKMVVDWVLITK